jgi:hypothetical protein
MRGRTQLSDVVVAESVDTLTIKIGQPAAWPANSEIEASNPPV